jgi:hypothetical protein
MKLSPNCIHVSDNVVRVQGPHGPVSLRRTSSDIEAIYQGDALANGSVQRYTESIRKAALQTVASFPFPWTYDSRGRQQITDHARYFEQTFNPELRGIETLRRWLYQSEIAATTGHFKPNSA